MVALKEWFWLPIETAEAVTSALQQWIHQLVHRLPLFRGHEFRALHAAGHLEHRHLQAGRQLSMRAEPEQKCRSRTNVELAVKSLLISDLKKENNQRAWLQVYDQLFFDSINFLFSFRRWMYQVFREPGGGTIESHVNSTLLSCCCLTRFSAKNDHFSEYCEWKKAFQMSLPCRKSLFSEKRDNRWLIDSYFWANFPFLLQFPS